MLQHTTLDDFLRGLYVKAVDTTPSGAPGKMTQHDKLLAQLMGTRDERDEIGGEGSRGPQLKFDYDGTADTASSAEALRQDKTIEMFRGENLRKIALQNLKERRQRQKQSEIFNQQDTAAGNKEAAEEAEETATGGSASGLERIDLTQTQLKAE
jgi:hypothetical protein